MSNTDQKPCTACSSTRVKQYALTCEAPGITFGKRVAFQECSDCGFVYAPDNTHDFESEHDFKGNNMPNDRHGRVGTSMHAGREYHMALMGKEVLELAELPCQSILIFGPGLSTDHVRLAMQFPGIRVAVCDLKNFQQVGNFVPLESNEHFDVLVACEVIEHFIDVASDFSGLLSKLSKTGLAVLSTNISDGSALSGLQYPFIGGHTAYYSGRSLAQIARRYAPDLHVDFRPPQAALAQLGPRKRYVLMHQDHRIAFGLAEYFSTHLMAPSEKSEHPRLLGRVRRLYQRQWRRLIGPKYAGHK